MATEATTTTTTTATSLITTTTIIPSISVTLPTIHDINRNETSPWFSLHLSPGGTQNVDSNLPSLTLDYHSSDGGGEEEGEEEEEREGDCDSGWPAERWVPLGAAYSPAPSPSPPTEASAIEVGDRLKHLEEEQTQMNSSLLALTSHFAQVQFRLKQIVNAEPTTREGLLKELEDFAFKGIPDVRGCLVQDAQALEEVSTKEHEERMIAQREKQRELIIQLKAQLEDLETFAYESGQAEALPTSRVMEKQRVVLEEVRSRLHIDLQHFDSLSTQELRDIVNNAITSIVSPAKVKEKLIGQLKTQVVDLERYIQFLQGETDSPGPYGEQRCTCPLHAKGASYDSDGQGCCGSTKARDGRKGRGEKPAGRRAKEDTAAELMKKALTILQIYVFSQLGCGGQQDPNQNLQKKAATENHWGELMDRLEGAISRTVELGLQQQQRDRQWRKDSCSTQGELINSDAEEVEMLSSPAVTMCVRKELAMAIRDLIQHGLVEVNKGRGMVRFGCFSQRSGDITHKMHAWDLLAKFYDMKHGHEYKESPARMLSQSFHLDMVGGRPITAKQTFLGAIDTVLNSHARHMHCGKDSYFKAFVCLALNERRLVTWLRLLFRTQTLIDSYYLDWSYAARTGFEDALQSLENLSVISFRLPVDLSVRSFNNIRDIF